MNRKSPNHLPSQYRFAHDYCIYLHDLLVIVVRTGEALRIFDASFTLKSQADADELHAMSKDDKERFWRWLKDKGYEDVIYAITYKQVIVALLADCCHFVLEGLNCSKKGKLTVAFSNFRKPLKDTLFYFEWLLADPKSCLDTFIKDGPDALEAKRNNKVFRQEIIGKAIVKMPAPKMFDAVVIEGLRYDRANPVSFAGLCDQAIHLVTTFNAIKTDVQNFNFVFSGDEARLSQWHFLYTTLPYLLNYAVVLVDSLLVTFAGFDEAAHLANDLRRYAGLAIWLGELQANQWATPVPMPSVADLGALMPKCPRCSERIVPRQADWKSLFEKASLRCSSCRKRIRF